jgi:Ca2+-binding EF-hand superfamily protein
VRCLQCPIRALRRKLLLAEAVDEEQILEQAFMFFDRDGNKEVSIAELTTVMGELGGLLTAEEIGTFVRLMDKNSDGVVRVSWRT